MSSIWESNHQNFGRKKYNFRDEEFKGETTIIGKFVLPSMKFEIINRRITQNPSSNEKKRKSKSQEIPLEIDISNNIIPQLPTIKDILKIINGKIDVINDRIDFIVQHFILD